MKKSFSLLELLFTISILSIFISFINIDYKENSLESAANRIVLYLKETRYQAFIDNKKTKSSNLWHKKRWTLKFLRCREDIGGIYYVIYSDENETGHPSLDESLSDPLTNKKIYSSNKCETTSSTSKYVLLTKEFGIDEVNITCNSTTSLGQLSFGNDGKVYSRLSNYENSENENEIENKCIIRLESQLYGSLGVVVEPKTGYVYRKK